MSSIAASLTIFYHFTSSADTHTHNTSQHTRKLLTNGNKGLPGGGDGDVLPGDEIVSQPPRGNAPCELGDEGQRGEHPILTNGKTV